MSNFHRDLRGLDLHAPSQELIENNTGAVIGALQIVTLNGMGAVYPQVKLHNGLAGLSFGIATQPIGIGQTGYITTVGFVFNVDTSAWAVNTALFSDSLGNLSTVSLGGKSVALVMRQDAQYGVLYVTALGDLITAVENVWTLLGNADTDPSINFIGTTDSQPIVIRTDGLERMRITEYGRIGIGTSNPNAHLEIKSHIESYATGLQLETFTMDTIDTNANYIYAINLVNNSVVTVEFNVTARQTDGLQRASFKRTAVFYKENSIVRILGQDWQSDFTRASSPGFDVSYQMGLTTVEFKVQAANSTLTHWAGFVTIQTIT